MAKYLKPKRGKFREATAQDIVLGKGELFLCMANDDDMGKGPGAIYVGDNMTSFTNYAHNGSTVPNTAQPFLIHPINYKPIFADSSPSTASWTIDAATSEINNIGNGTGQVTLPNIIGNIKGALSKHANSINAINNSINYAKYINSSSTYHLNDYHYQNGMYIFSHNTPITNLPDPSCNASTVATKGSNFTLQVIRNEKDPTVTISEPEGTRNIICTQILYNLDICSTIFTRHYVAEKISSTMGENRWTNWERQVNSNNDLLLYIDIDRINASSLHSFNLQQPTVNYQYLQFMTGHYYNVYDTNIIPIDKFDYLKDEGTHLRMQMRLSGADCEIHVMKDTSDPKKIYVWGSGNYYDKCTLEIRGINKIMNE